MISKRPNDFLFAKREDEIVKICISKQYFENEKRWYIGFYHKTKHGKCDCIPKYLNFDLNQYDDIRHCLTGWIECFKMDIERNP